MWSNININGQNYSHLHQTETFSCAPSCVAMAIWNMGVGVGFDGWAKSTAKWSKYTNGLKPELEQHTWADNLNHVGMNMDSTSTLLNKYGLNHELYQFDVNGVPLQHSNAEALRLQNMRAGDMAMVCNAMHVVLVIKQANGFIFLDPAYGTADPTRQSGWADPMAGDGLEILDAAGNINETALFFNIHPDINFGPIAAVFHIPNQNLVTTQLKSLGQSISSLHQYLTYYLN